MLSTRRLFIKQIGLGTLGLGLLTTLPGHSIASPVTKPVLPRSTPEKQGVSSSGILRFLDEVEKSGIEFHSIMIVRHGHVIAGGWWAPYAAPLKHTLYSLSKSFTSTAVGLAIDEGKFTVEDAVLSFFPNDIPADVNEHLKAMKVKHLLTMSSGHVKDTIQPMRASTTDTWAKTFFSQPVEREPGTFFHYNTGATYMLSAIVQKTTGQPLIKYLRPRLFDPLGIEGEDWETDPQGINTGGYGLRIRTEDIAKFGQLYLQKGKWNGRQILPTDWIEQATKTQIVSSSSNPTRPRDQDDWAQGYGYQFWRCRPGGYRADGAFGQFSMVMPEYDAVIAITSESFAMQKSMDLIWTHLLPTMDKTKASLPADNKSVNDLQKKLKGLALSPPQNNPKSSLMSRISGKEFLLEANEFNVKGITLDFNDSSCVFSLKDEKGTHQIVCGINAWNVQKNEGKGTPFPVAGRMEVSTAIAASATWNDDKTLLMTLRLIESAHTNMFAFIFEDNAVTLKFSSSIAVGKPTSPDKRSDIKGTMVV
jgi:CubicO group peptidase (beta-lactamase class C family)